MNEKQFRTELEKAKRERQAASTQMATATADLRSLLEQVENFDEMTFKEVCKAGGISVRVGYYMLQRK
jgi:hypothetical protein